VQKGTLEPRWDEALELTLPPELAAQGAAGLALHAVVYDWDRVAPSCVAYVPVSACDGHGDGYPQFCMRLRDYDCARWQVGADEPIGELLVDLATVRACLGI
jgi:hypothetical protein